VSRAFPAGWQETANSIYQRQGERIFSVSGDATMQIAEWRKTIGEMVREHMRSAGLEHYFSVKMNKPRAQLTITQLGLYIRHRRDC